MDPSAEARSSVQPKTFAELLPDLCGIMSEDVVRTLTSTKKRKPSQALSTNKESNIRPKTMAEITADILATQGPPTKHSTQQQTLKKKWNSSVKVNHKKTNHTGGEKQVRSSVRKVLNFQMKPKTQPISAVTPKFTKPEPRAKKSLLPVQGKNNVRISGICVIPPTPQSNINTPLSRVTICHKESDSQKVNSNRKSVVPSKIALSNVQKKYQPIISEISLSNISSDASFLQREKEINDEHRDLTAVDPTLENIAEISPPMSTPFKNYRSVHEFFMNDSTAMENSVKLQLDNTVMLFEKPAPNANKDDSTISSLCDLLNKATVTTYNSPIKINEFSEENELLEMEKQELKNIDNINNVINIMNKLKESHEASLSVISKLIQNRQVLASKALEEKETDRTLVMEEVQVSVETETSITNNGLRNYSVIKCTRSPTYTIPKKSSYLRKKLHKSMPNSLNVATPEQSFANGNRAISMYMKIKENMSFLNTPVSNRWPNAQAEDTPAITSRNLQMQLDKLYNDS